MVKTYGIVQLLPYVLKNPGELRLILMSTMAGVMGHQTKIDLGQMTSFRIR